MPTSTPSDAGENQNVAQTTVNSSFDLDTLRSAPKPDFVQLFMDNLADVFRFGGKDIQSTLGLENMDLLFTLRLALKDKAAQSFPDLKSKQLVNRQVKHTITNDIVLLGHSIVNSSPLKDLDKVFQLSDAKLKDQDTPPGQKAEVEIASLFKSIQDLSAGLIKVESENKRLSKVTSNLQNDLQEATDERAALRILLKDLQAHANTLEGQINTKSPPLGSPKDTSVPGAGATQTVNNKISPSAPMSGSTQTEPIKVSSSAPVTGSTQTNTVKITNFEVLDSSDSEGEETGVTSASETDASHPSESPPVEKQRKKRKLHKLVGAKSSSQKIKPKTPKPGLAAVKDKTQTLYFGGVALHITKADIRHELLSVGVIKPVIEPLARGSSAQSFKVFVHQEEGKLALEADWPEGVTVREFSGHSPARPNNRPSGGRTGGRPSNQNPNQNGQQPRFNRGPRQGRRRGNQRHYPDQPFPSDYRQSSPPWDYGPDYPYGPDYSYGPDYPRQRPYRGQSHRRSW